MQRRRNLLLALGLSLSLIVSGCVQGNSAGSGTKTIRVGTWESGDALKLQQQIADNYMKTHKNVEIKIEAVPDGYGTKLLTQIAAGDAPDIFQIGDGDIRMFKEKGALEDLTPYMKSINLDDYNTNILDVGKIDGKYYTMPKDYTDLAVFYNKKLFDEAKIPYPQAGWTWDQLYETAKKLTKKDGDKYVQWGFLLDNWAVQPLINSHGGSLISPDGSGFEGYMNSDGTVKALELYQDMLKDHISPSTTESESFKGVDLFAAGKVAMSINGRWPVENYKKNPNLSFGTVPLPVGPKGAANSICYAGYGLYSKSKNKKEAWDYLSYLTGPEGQEVLAQHLGFTAVKSVSEKLGHAKDEHLKAFLDDLPNVYVWPELISPLYGKTGAKAFQTVMDKINLGKPIDIKAELDAAAKQADADLKKLKAEQ